jgi:hypothetical protein
MRDYRKVLLEMVADEKNSDMNLLGCVLSCLRANGGVEGRRIAEAADRAIQTEVLTMMAEHRSASQTPS